MRIISYLSLYKNQQIKSIGFAPIVRFRVRIAAYPLRFLFGRDTIEKNHTGDVDMAKKKINLEEIIALTKELFHAHFEGNLDKWFSYLCKESVYIGTGEPLLFGGDAIREHFKDFSGKQADIISEEYYPISLSDQAANVVGQIIVKSADNKFRIITHFTVGYRLIGDELKVVHQHNSYEFMQSNESELHGTVQLDINTTQFVRRLLLDIPSVSRISIKSGTQTVFVNPHTILYVQSQRKRTDIVCIDKVISCNSTISEIKDIVPDFFYPIHRCYLVNTLYITAVRRFEAELISGISIPIPKLTYMQAKQDLQNIIGNSDIIKSY